MWRRLLDGSWNGLLPAAVGLSHLLESEADRALAITPLSARGFVVLYEIARVPPASQRSLAARLGLSRSAMSELLKRLRRRGLVSLNQSRHGGRRGQTPGPVGEAAVSLTEPGRSTLERAERIVAKLEDDWAERLAMTVRNPVPRMRAAGLRRWLIESRAALATQGRGARDALRLG